VATGTITLTRPVILNHCTGVTITGGTWNDPNKAPGTAFGGGIGAGRPAFDIIGGSNIKVENLSIVGVNKGGYFPHLAFNGGIETQGTSGLTVSGVNVSHVFGDCLTLDPLRAASGPDYIVAVVRGLTVNGFTGNVCGRQGIGLVSVNGATLTNVTIGATGFDPFDAEADQPGKEGAKNVTVDQCSFAGLVAITAGGGATGPITFSHCTMTGTRSGDVLMVKNTSHKPDAGPITFSNDTLRCGASAYVSCFQLDGATNAVVQDSTVTIGYTQDAMHESTYALSNNTHLTFANDIIKGFGKVGVTDASSTATVTGGIWTAQTCHLPAGCPKR
jgi:hypothetical protein